MNRFRARNQSQATLRSSQDKVWEVLTDPVLLTKLTPYLHRIDVDGKHWTWNLTHIPVMSATVAPTFTEVMTFDEPSRIDFVHDPEQTDEKAGVDGRYVLKEAGQGTDLGIELSIAVELPFPKVARPAVHTAMRAVIASMGARFSHNLVRHLARDDA